MSPTVQPGSGDTEKVFFDFAFPEDMILPPSIDPAAKLIVVVKGSNLNKCNLGLGASFSNHLGPNAQVNSSMPPTAVALSLELAGGGIRRLASVQSNRHLDGI